MKIKSAIYKVLIFGLMLPLFFNCKKEDVPTSTTQFLPVLTTTLPLDVTSTSATCGGNISSDGGAAVTARGVCWSANQNPTISDSKTTNGQGLGSFTSSITGLSSKTTYYFRAYATNSAGTAYGDWVTITTTAFLPAITTNAVSDLTSIIATSGGDILSDGGAVITSSGICWSTSQYPTIDNNKIAYNRKETGSFTIRIEGLVANTTYYLRAYVTNSAGTGYGDVISFTTKSSVIVFNPSLSYGTVNDVDGNIYKTITIGTQTWMAENLRTTYYRNGDAIPEVADNTAWGNLSAGAYCNYNNTSAKDNIATYGRLYNWYAVSDSRKIAPIGWHVATHAEWATLITYLGGENVAGGKMKEVGTTHWISPNVEASNSSGFTAIPGGMREKNDILGSQYGGLGYNNWWWSSTSSDASNAWFRSLYSDATVILYNAYNKSDGLYVRCVKD